MSPLLMGVDAGTSAIKAQIIDDHGQIKAEASRAFFCTPTADGGAEYEPDELWQTARETIRDALGQLEDAKSVKGIACTGVGESGILVDADGSVCSRSMAWYDPRPVAQLDELLARYGHKELVERSGMRATPIAGLCKLMWIRDHDPKALQRARHWLHTSDFIAYRLSGVAATDLTLAGRTLALDLTSQSWNRERLNDQGIPDRLLPDLSDNGAVLGPVRDDVAADLGLAGNCMIVNGGHDHLIGALACGIFGRDCLLDSLGTAEAIMIPADNILSDERTADWGIEQVMLRIDGEAIHYVFGGLNTASACIEWFRSEIAGKQSYDDLAELAGRVKIGSDGLVFLPYLRGISPPLTQTGQHGAFLNLGTQAGLAHMFRAILEGLAFDARRMADCLIDLSGKEALPDRIVVTGGSSQNGFLMKLKAAVYDRELEVVTAPQSVSLGAALLAGVGTGVFSDWRQAVAKAGAATRTIVPDRSDSSVYQSLYQSSFLPKVNGLQQMVRQQP